MSKKTPRYGHAPVVMNLKARTNEMREVGDFRWRAVDPVTGRRVLVLAIPYGGERKWVLAEFTINHKNESGAQWSWNGDEYKPTLTPSLHAVGIWHGWVRDGKLVEA